LYCILPSDLALPRKDRSGSPSTHFACRKSLLNESSAKPGAMFPPHFGQAFVGYLLRTAISFGFAFTVAALGPVALAAAD
jgi:hypothetical protein